jgi:predicted protein tyrosine phosphatase
MRTFVWCAQSMIKLCHRMNRPAHSHICIRSVGAQIVAPSCEGEALHLEFYDLDPDSIRRTRAFEGDPVRGQEIIDGCFTEAQAKAVVGFVGRRPDTELMVINCEAGVSRSPGVVLALRRHFGGDEREVFEKAIPNIYVTSMLFRALRAAREA